ncbi:VWA domain-containing protein [Roseiconus nitratireducens]|uniref:VWA domain-containing protein n=1 Tax=Roseiconus nitratireducens TaxID=2605748 RepID=A0A5M6DCE9_9BACT|nr:VWA domain-containing protein [Roseiconus nitratireducens]KAA5545237.1 VWA domain-containing protein [Roseiconus nitratireducens]
MKSWNSIRPARLLAVCVAGFAVCAASPPSASAQQVSLDVGVCNPVMLAGEKQTNYLRIALTGSDLPQSESRPPINAAIVIDQSGSMSGQKIVQAREAAITAVRRLRDDDIVAVILYADSAHVLVPATRATDREAIVEKIRSVNAGGSTALFAGVSKGAAEVRKFLDSDSVNRVILLSDGQANVGPQSPRELERLGASLVKEGISVSTLGLGLGYNEDLMSRLAAAGSGNHMFVEQADDLVAVFQREFNDLMSVVANDFEIHARIGEGIRPVRVLNTKADISGQDIYIPLAQLYARQERYFVIEVEVDAGHVGDSRTMANVSVKYRNLISETRDKLTSRVEIRFTDDQESVAKHRDAETYAYCALQIANEKNVRATALRDAGRIEEAEQLLMKNSDELRQIEMDYGVQLGKVIKDELKRNINLNSAQSSIIADPKKWSAGRKAMRYEQSNNASQQNQRVAPPSKSPPSGGN